MTDQLLYIAVAIGAGMCNAVQLGMVGAIKQDRGTFEATWISMLASLAGMALLLGVTGAFVGKPNLPSLFAHPLTYVALTIFMASLLILASWGLAPGYMLTGMLAIPYLLAAAWAGPKIGLGVYFAAVVTGQLTGSTALDHFGAFGSVERHVDWLRAAGIVVLLIGVAMIRGGD